MEGEQEWSFKVSFIFDNEGLREENNDVKAGTAIWRSFFSRLGPGV